MRSRHYLGLALAYLIPLAVLPGFGLWLYDFIWNSWSVSAMFPDELVFPRDWYLVIVLILFGSAIAMLLGGVFFAWGRLLVAIGLIEEGTDDDEGSRRAGRRNESNELT